MEVIDAFKRLERAGSETSRATQKLKSAAELIADKMAWDIAGIANLEELPRGYSYAAIDMNGPLGVRCKAFLLKDGFILNHESLRSCSNFAIAESADTLDALGINYHRVNYDDLGFDPTPMDVYRQFARDIATGLLDEITSCLEAERENIGRELDACSSATN